MSNATLKKKIDDAFAPYAKGFCAQPSKVNVDVTVDDTDALAFFQMSATDFATIDGDSLVKSVITRAYAGLVRKVSDNGRNPILVYGIA